MGFAGSWALEALDQAFVSGTVRSGHNAVARLAGHGADGL